jgi:hypothetical protein
VLPARLIQLTGNRYRRAVRRACFLAVLLSFLVAVPSAHAVSRAGARKVALRALHAQLRHSGPTLHVLDPAGYDEWGFRKNTLHIEITLTGSGAPQNAGTVRAVWD